MRHFWNGVRIMLELVGIGLSLAVATRSTGDTYVMAELAALVVTIALVIEFIGWVTSPSAM